MIQHINDPDGLKCLRSFLKAELAVENLGLPLSSPLPSPILTLLSRFSCCSVEVRRTPQREDARKS
jgi:hypothetical protein